MSNSTPFKQLDLCNTRSEKAEEEEEEETRVLWGNLYECDWREISIEKWTWNDSFKNIKSRVYGQMGTMNDM